MGSFNTTCFASQQTISTGNKCYVLPIIQQSGYNPVKLSRDGKETEAYGVTSSTCYPTAFWKPFSTFIAAEYDDYGKVIVDRSTKSNKRDISSFFAMLEEYCYKTEQGENKCHDVPFDFEVFLGKGDFEQSWDYMWDAVHEHRLFVRNYKGVPAQLSFAIISAPAYNELVLMMEKATDWDGNSISCEAKLERAIERILEKNKTLPKDDTATSASLRRFELADILGTLLNGHGQEGMPRLTTFAYEDHLEILNEICNGTLSEESRAAIIKTLNIGQVFGALTELNIKLTPLVYASQDYDNSIGRAYAKFIRSVSAAVTAGQKERHGG